MTDRDWNPESYARFGGLRLRPALDLLARVGGLPQGDIFDLGCGAGAVGPALRTRFPERRIFGVDSSPAMLEEAEATGVYDAVLEGDAARWAPDRPAALIFSNAALHWVGDHAQLMPRLAGCLAAGGMLAVQMPHQNRAPSHRLWRDLAAQHFPDRAARDASPGILEPADYVRIFEGLGELDLWETEYFQVLPPAEGMHPVRAFTSSTFARPVLARLSEAEAAKLARLYDEAIGAAYPCAPDGSVLFPFRRMFFTLSTGAPPED